MTTHPIGPRLIRAGIVVLDPLTGAVRRVIALQYNPDTLTRSLQIQATGGEGGDRSEALRLKAPPVETIRLEAEIDATDRLEEPERHRAATAVGIFPDLAVLETLAYPGSAQLRANHQRAGGGELEIVPVQAPLTLFVWSKTRVVPVRIAELSVTEEAFDANLNPIRAKVTLSLRALSVADVGFDHRGGSLFMAHLAVKEQLGALDQPPALGALGINGVPS